MAKQTPLSGKGRRAASLLPLALIFAFLTPVSFAQQAPPARGGGQRGAPAGPAKPTPRTAQGGVNLGALPGETGLWLPAGGGGERLTDANDAAAGPGTFPGKLKEQDVPYQAWARELNAYRVEDRLEPHTRCKPSGGPRQFLTPYGVEFVEIPDLKRIYIMDVGGPHTLRVIFMDRAAHPRDLSPSYYGDSIGRWEGDTLIVDSVGFNEKFWIDRFGLPHTEKLHLVEKFTRTDSNTMKYEVTVEDPGTYTGVWTSGFFLRWTPSQELFEYVCQDNNFGSELMVGTAQSVDRFSHIVP